MAATCFVQPLDLLKNRMQLSGKYLFILHHLTIHAHIIFLHFMHFVQR